MLTFLVVGTIALAKLALFITVGFESPLLIFFAAVTLSAWLGGCRQGLLATFLSLLLVLLFAFSGYAHPPPPATLASRLGIFGVNGLLISFVCAKLRATKKELERLDFTSQRFLNSVVENLPNMIFVKDAKDLRFIRFNLAGEMLLGRDRKELIGKNDRDFFPPEEADAFIANDRAVLTNKAVLDIPEETITTPKGVRVLHTKKIPILDAQGEALYLLGISEDITEKKEAIGQTRELERARAARLEAESADRAKSAFLANISHEIRTPLGAMLGFAELALDDETISVSQRNFLSTIARNAQHLHHLVDELLDLSKAEADRLVLENGVFSPAALMADVSTLLGLKAEKKGLELRLWCPQRLPDQLIGDAARIRQILINIVGNSIKFTEKGSVELRASFIDDGHGAGVLQFSVEDSGIGICPENAAKLFQPFTQGDNSTSRRFGGTGLGLFLSRKLARLMGGDVVLESSAPGRGSRWLVTLTAKNASTTQVVALREEPPAHVPPRISTSRRVLIVDDSADNRFLFQIFLERIGFECDLAEDGFQAVKLTEKNEFALVLMDIQMPGMDGFEAVKTLRAANYRAPVVALTAHAMKGDRERCLLAGFDDYLQKPIQRTTLEKMLEKYAPLGEKENKRVFPAPSAMV